MSFFLRLSRSGMLLWLFLVLAPAHAQYGGSLFVESASLTSAQGTFHVSFGEKIPWDFNSPDPTTEDLTVVKPGSDLLQGFSSSVIRAMNTLEKTFANTNSRTINVRCIFTVNPERTAGASADPVYAPGNKDVYTDADFNGKFTGQKASVNNLEHIWKYGEYLPDRNTDVDIYFIGSTASFQEFYIQESTAGYFNGKLDAETITLHEMGHILGFNKGVDGGKSALDLFVTSQPSSLPNGGIETYFTGEAANALNGSPVMLMAGADGYDAHIMKPNGSLMSDGTYNPGTARQFTNVELAMFQDMGWTLAVPEPSSCSLAVMAAVALILRRTRTPDFPAREKPSNK